VPNSPNLKIKDGGGRHLEFRINVNNSGLDKDIYTKFYRNMRRGYTNTISSLDTPYSYSTMSHDFE